MCDALSWNVPKLVETLVANDADNRRNFVKVNVSFPEPCRFVLETLGEVYGDDVRRHGLRACRRKNAWWRFHPGAEPAGDGNLHTWCQVQFDEGKRTELSGLGRAISYLLNHWENSRSFCERRASIDSNLVERALKKAILHRKNSLFYKTRRGGDGRSVHEPIHTRELNGVNPFDYLTDLQRHAEDLKEIHRSGCPERRHTRLGSRRLRLQKQKG